MRAGRFRQANDIFSSSLHRDEKQSAEGCLTEAELLIALGLIRDGRTVALPLINERYEASTRACAHWLTGQVEYYLGRPAETRQHFEAAGRLAHSTRGTHPHLYATVLLTTLRFMLRATPIDGLDVEIKEARRAVAHAGDSHLLADLRLTVAELETRKGFFGEALRHLSQAQKLVRDTGDLFIEGVFWNHKSNVHALIGDTYAARDYAERAFQCSNESGHFRIRIGSQMNLAQLDLAAGRTGDVEEKLKRLIGASKDHFQLRLAGLDALANYYLASGRVYDARQCLAKILRARRLARHRHNNWEYLTETYSRANIALLEGNRLAAHSILLRGFEKAVTAGDSIWARNFQLRLAQLEAAANAKEATSRLIPVALATNCNAEAFARVCFTRGVIEQVLQRPEAARQFHRVDRITRSLNLFAIREDAKTVGIPLTDGERAIPPVFDDATAIIELSAYPHVLAREAYALLDGAGVAERLALLARGASGVRVLAAARWDNAAVVRAANDLKDRLQIICGVHRDETWEVIAELKPSLSDRCTAVAVRQLVDTAVTLDRYRREEKQRTALWPADSFETDGGLFVSEQMSDLLSIARRIAPADITVLLTGETGTGKEVLARAIHRASPRAAKPFVPFNCTAVAREMLESQLFGYRKGAFTGADGAFEGVIRGAAGGTLFLDEIAEIGPDLQPKLLRFLETREVHALGESQPVTVDVRVIAATNADLEAMVADGRFREDLFYRLNVVRLKLPPLRERREEIPPLIDHYLRKAAEELRKGRLTLEDETLEYLLLYAWPGNVRQLVNEIRRIAAFAEPDAVITPALLSTEIQASRRTIRVTEGDVPEVRVRLDQPLGDALEAIEQAMVRRALERSNGNYENAARLLGISRKGLFLKRRRWGMQKVS
jgi:transcriptional regulator with PAS, ATPase and Fis domain/tetratricopeptide (TPR) repeat protein